MPGLAHISSSPEISFAVSNLSEDTPKLIAPLPLSEVSCVRACLASCVHACVRACGVCRRTQPRLHARGRPFFFQPEISSLQESMGRQQAALGQRGAFTSLSKQNHSSPLLSAGGTPIEAQKPPALSSFALVSKDFHCSTQWFQVVLSCRFGVLNRDSLPFSYSRVGATQQYTSQNTGKEMTREDRRRRRPHSSTFFQEGHSDQTQPLALKPIKGRVVQHTWLLEVFVARRRCGDGRTECTMVVGERWFVACLCQSVHHSVSLSLSLRFLVR